MVERIKLNRPEIAYPDHVLNSQEQAAVRKVASGIVNNTTPALNVAATHDGRLSQPIFEEGDSSISDVPRHRLIPAVQCIVMGVLYRRPEHFARLQAEVVAADRSARLRGEQPPPQSRIVEEYKKHAPSEGEELVGLIRAKRLKAYEQCRDGVFRELAPEFWDEPQSKGALEAALSKPFGKPLRHAIYLDRSEIENLWRSDLGDQASPVVKPVLSVRQKPLPRRKLQDVIRVLESLPHLRRAEQAKAVRAQFPDFRITDSILREAARSAPLPRGRPRRR